MSPEQVVELEGVNEHNEDLEAFLVPPDGGERIENPLGGERSCSRFAACRRARR